MIGLAAASPMLATAIKNTSVAHLPQVMILNMVFAP
jgi:hypothetical protein